MKTSYLQTIQLVERLHRQCLEMVKAELERLAIRDLNNVQALILFNIGEEELTVGELTQRGYYLGSNVSYNVKKLVENGYLIQQRSLHDRRSFHVKASERGVAVYRHLSALFEHHVAEMPDAGFTPEGLTEAGRVLARLLRFWSAPGTARSVSLTDAA
jgi:DNA-binding MarR family transcriptional regulator